MRDADRPEPSRTPLWTTVLLVLAGAAALWAASAVQWLTGQYQTPFQGVRPAGVTGSQVRPELVPLALVSLAGVAAVLATGGWLRRIVGMLVVFVGGVLAARAGSWLLGGESAGFTPEGLPPGSTPLGGPTISQLGPVLALLGAVSLLVAGMVVILRARRMPGMGARYSAPGSERKSRDPDKRLWDELSEGRDPTTERDEGPEQAR